MKFRKSSSAILYLLIVSGSSDTAFAAGAAFLHDTAIAALSDDDKKLQHDTAITVLNNDEAKFSQEWSNPKTRSSGRSESLGNFKSEDGLRCKKLRLFTHAKGVESQLTFPVCQNSGGQWFIASGKTLSKA